MLEVAPHYLINNHWARIDLLYPELEQRAWEREHQKTGPEFVNPTESTPVSFAEILSHLQLPRRVLKRVSERYRRNPVYPEEAMLKALLFKEGKRFKFDTELQRYLETHPEEALLLGFKEGDGAVRVPSSKTFWHFANVRLKDDWHDIFRDFRDDLVYLAHEHGVTIGKKVTDDATPIKAKRNDPDAAYNDHYKVRGYKFDTLSDLDLGLPLEYMVEPINYDEAKCLPTHILSLETKSSVSFNIEGVWIDGGYTDLVNLAFMGIRGIEVHYRIEKNWRWAKEGTEENLRRLYQKHWNDPRFKANADMAYIQWFLVEMGHEKEVGYYFRNQALRRHEENPDAYMKNYHQRSRKEGEQGYFKVHLELEERVVVKGRDRVERYLARNLCTILAVALVRLQHGVTDKLTSLAFIT